MTATATHHHVLTEPESGQVIDLPVGASLELKFEQRGICRSEWHVEDRPSHLAVLHESSHGFLFLVFRAGDSGVQTSSLRLVRRRVEQSTFSEVRDLTLVVTP